jgi:excisionase family DNA binding protein
MEQLLYTVPEAATVLRLSRAFVYTLVSSGELESVKLGRARRIPAQGLSTFLERLRAQGGDGA